MWWAAVPNLHELDEAARLLGWDNWWTMRADCFYAWTDLVRERSVVADRFRAVADMDVDCSQTCSIRPNAS